MRPRMRTDTVGSLRSLVEAGAGITILDEPSARVSIKEGRLRRLLPEWRLPEGGQFAVFPPVRHLLRQAQAFVEFHRNKMAQLAVAK